MIRKTAHTIIAASAAFLLASQFALADISGNPEKIPGWVVAYEVDTQGAVTRGSLNRLRNAVRSGADVKLGLNLDGQGSVITCDRANLFLFSAVEHVACQTQSTVALINGTDPNLVIRPTPYRTYQWFDTVGRQAVARASIYGGSNVGQTVTQIGSLATWFVRVR